ncbi:XRE family transcriptional regulator [Nonomuraea terrae]|uniref:XRE family transcriptional regulator n=1 Tax=Nonomuraea terrae TaxID=2530383 RepID=A0A4R4YPE8_9ACTN|nr:helix-turn-helix transcriptional regulator [Nonomuraea terrae]TDD47028.1 XRE family transcriptional regulator [Nonomuraea terrae]
METFEELADRLAEALDEAAEGIREALRSQGRPQKHLANRVRDASPSLISRWLSGSRQLAERNRLPGAEVMREIAKVLDLPVERAQALVALGDTIDGLRKRLEADERGWRARAAERLSRPDGPASPSYEPPSAGEPSVVRRTVSLITATVAAAAVGVITFLGGVLAGRGWAPEAEPVNTTTSTPVATERCSPWTDAGQGVQVEACVRIRDSRMLIRTRLRGPIGMRADMMVQAYDTFLEKPVTKELKCHQMSVMVAGQVHTCGWHEIRPPYGSEYSARAGWRPAGEGVFGGFVESAGVRW